MITTAECRARLKLFRTENVGPMTFDRLLQRYGTAHRALDVLPELSARGGKSIRLCPDSIVDQELERIAAYGAQLIFKGTKEYPSLLAEIDDAPPLLTVKGDIKFLSRPSLAVVGARNASLVGKKLATEFAQKVSDAGFVIVSGLARGIDAAAHTAALRMGTVAVVAGGVDVIYPPENADLQHQIAEQGAIIAESPFGAEPVARLFPKRNRIVSGLSLGTLIVEAAAKSGSLITARLAAEQNREVFAVPGSPLDPRAEGTNGLIRDGAHLVTQIDDILPILRGLRHQPLRDSDANPWQGPQWVETFPSDALRDKVLENLSPVPILMDELVRAVKAPVPEVLTILLELELAGRLVRTPGNKVSLI